MTETHASSTRYLQCLSFAHLFFALSPLPLYAQASNLPDLTISAIQAHLLSTKTGQLSPDVLATTTAPNVSLNNIIAGDNASISTLVKIRLSLADVKRLPQQAIVRLVATERGKRGSRVVLDQSSRVGPFSGDGMSYVGFWLASTGCATISLKATLNATVSSAKQSSTMSSVIPFSCNE